MAADASTTAAIVGIFVAVLIAAITINTPSQTALQRFYRFCVSLWKPSATTCAAFRWSDICTANPAIRLHVHPAAVGDCRQCNVPAPAFHSACQRRCWESSVQLIFGRIWATDDRRVAKPLELPLGEDYLCTDMDVIIAYILLTAGNEPFQAKMLGGWTKYLKLENDIPAAAARNLRVGHVGPPQRSGWQLDLTLDELDKIKEGWPPFYRRTFTSFEGYALESPMQSVNDIRRPGWVVSLGLAPIQPTAVYIERDPDGDMFGTVLKRLITMLRGPGGVLSRWGGNKDLSFVVGRILDMVENTGATEFGQYVLPAYRPKSVVAYPSLQQNEMSDLSQQQCTALMDMFNSFYLKLEGNDEIISPNVVECMKRVHLGVWVALWYMNWNRRLVVPQGLDEQTVYLGPCPR